MMVREGPFIIYDNPSIVSWLKHYETMLKSEVIITLFVFHFCATKVPNIVHISTSHEATLGVTHPNHLTKIQVVPKDNLTTKLKPSYDIQMAEEMNISVQCFQVVTKG